MIGRRSRGFSLVEMFAVMALMAIILGIVGVLSISLRRSERMTHADLAEEMTYLRLSRDFRRDVHHAASLEEIAEKETTGVRLLNPAGPSVEYRAKGQVVSRSLMANAEGASSLERYDLGRNTVAGFDHGGGAVTLRFGTSPDARREFVARIGQKGGQE
jgi:prepilin-type N-terminal cleavage/methylation domain-containing protein